MDNSKIEDGKTYAFVAYLTLIGTLIAFFMNQDKRNAFTSFHIRQGLGLWILYMALGYVVGGFDSWMLTMAFWIFFSVLFIYGIVGALQGKYHSVPILGDLFQKIFKSVGQ